MSKVHIVVATRPVLEPEGVYTTGQPRICKSQKEAAEFAKRPSWRHGDQKDVAAFKKGDGYLVSPDGPPEKPAAKKTATKKGGGKKSEAADPAAAAGSALGSSGSSDAGADPGAAETGASSDGVQGATDPDPAPLLG